MTRKELQSALRELGFTRLCSDKKTLCAYNQIQYFLYANRTPIKAITSVYLENNDLRIVLNYDIDLESGYSLLDENF